MEHMLWLEYCRLVKIHHRDQTLESLTAAINAHAAWRQEFLRG